MEEKERHNAAIDPLGDALTANQDRLFALISMMMPCHTQDVMDVLQATNQAVILSSPSFDASRPAWPWIKAIAIKHVKDYFRVLERDRVTVDSELVDRLGERVSDERANAELDREDYFEALHACMGKLPPLKRDFLRERYSEGVAVKDMARRHSVSALSLATLICRLRQSLADCIQRRVALFRKGREPEGNGAFDQTLDFFLDGALSSEQREAFAKELLHSSSDELDAYIRQAFLHAFLKCRHRQVFQEDVVPSRAGKPVFRVLAVAAAAAVLALLLVGGLALSRRVSVKKALPPPASVAVLPREPARAAAERRPVPESLPPSAPPEVKMSVSSAAVVAAEPQKKENAAMKTKNAALAAAAVAVATAVAPSLAELPQAVVEKSTAYATVNVDTATKTRSVADLESLDTVTRTTARSKGFCFLSTKFKGLVVMLM